MRRPRKARWPRPGIVLGTAAAIASVAVGTGLSNAAANAAPGLIAAVIDAATATPAPVSGGARTTPSGTASGAAASDGGSESDRARPSVGATVSATPTTPTSTPSTMAGSDAMTALSPSAISSAASTSVFQGGLYVPTATQAAAQAQSLSAAGDESAAAAAKTIASYPTAVWLGDWLSDHQLASTISSTLDGAASTGTTPVFVTYAIPDRDCGGYSAGGFDASDYAAWTTRVASLLAGHRAAVIVEPDSLALLTNCPAAASVRLPLIAAEVHELHDAGIPAYLDAGNSHWNPASVMVPRLQAAGIAEARGFFTNVSNYYPTADERAYASTLSGMLGGAHYVIDTSRNGQGWKGTWCNAPGAGLGLPPSVIADGTDLDALLWVKPPGESDGTCDGHPAAGAWDPAYATALVANRAG